MPLGTVDRTPPPFFKQGSSALSKLLVLSALAVFLMVLDTRLKMSQPIRQVMASALYPLQWVVHLPSRGWGWVSDHFVGLETAQNEAKQAQAQLMTQVQRAALVEHLAQENRRLRELLDMQARLSQPGLGAEVLHEAGDPYSRKVVIDRGSMGGVTPGSAVMDGRGVIGQVTRVYPMTSEVTLLVDRDQAIAVLNTRTGQRSLAYGRPGPQGGELELRFMAANADVQEGDLLTTSGIDRVYPAGLPVAQVLSVQRGGQDVFAQILARPSAQMNGVTQVLVLPAISEPGARQ